jgi:hypothetical protein
VKVIFDRTEIRRVLTVAEDGFELFLLHADLHGELLKSARQRAKS